MTETRTFDKLRCCKCGRTIAKVSPDLALRAGSVIEIKCGCNAMNYLCGVDAAEGSGAETSRNLPKP